MDNDFNNDNMQPNQAPNPEQTSQGKDFSSQYAQYNQPRNGFDNQNADANPYQQPDYNQYQPQQPVHPDYNQYQPQQPVQPDYGQYQPQQPVQPDYNQYQPQQPAQPDYYNQYQNNPVQPYDYNQAGYQQPTYQQGNVYNAVPADRPTGAAKVFSIISLVCGILSMVCCCYGFIPAIPGIVFAAIAKAKFKGKNTMATLGLVFSIVGCVISVVSLIVIIVTGVFENSSSYHYYY